jgi:hypothetical protein
MNFEASSQRLPRAHTVVPVAHQKRLMVAAGCRNHNEIDNITDELVALGLARPRHCTALGLAASRVRSVALAMGGRVL